MRVRHLPPLIYLVLSVLQLLLVILPWGQKYIYIWNDTKPIYSLFWEIINYFSFKLLIYFDSFFPVGVLNVPVVVPLLIFGTVSLIIYYLIGLGLEIILNKLRLLLNKNRVYKLGGKTAITLSIIFLLTAISAIGYLYWRIQSLESKQTRNIGRQDNKINQENDNQKINWEWYKNERYNFEFTYPAHIFVTEQVGEHDDYYWQNKSGVNGPFGLGEDGLWMNMQVSSENHIRLDNYQKIIELKPGQQIEDLAITRLYDLNTDGVRGAFYFEGPPKSKATEAAYSYVAVWIKGNRYYLLNLSAFSEETLKKNQYTMDNILASFHFLEKEDSSLSAQAVNWKTYSFSGYPVVVKIPQDLKVIEKPNGFNGITRVIEISNNESTLTINVEEGAFGREGGNLEYSTEPLIVDNEKVVIGKSLIEKNKIVDKDNRSVGFEVFIRYPDHRDYWILASYQFPDGRITEQTVSLFDIIISTIRFT